jgi:hypothetical protein
MRPLTGGTLRIGFTIAVALTASSARADDVYLDKLSKTLDGWWNTLDSICRGMPGDSDASNLVCEQRLQLDSLFKKMGCWNIYGILHFTYCKERRKPFEWSTTSCLANSSPRRSFGRQLRGISGRGVSPQSSKQPESCSKHIHQRKSRPFLTARVFRRRREIVHRRTPDPEIRVPA